MLTSPYKPELQKRSAALILKDEEREKAKCIDQFMKELARKMNTH